MWQTKLNINKLKSLNDPGTLTVPPFKGRHPMAERKKKNRTKLADGVQDGGTESETKQFGGVATRPAAEPKQFWWAATLVAMATTEQVRWAAARKMAAKNILMIKIFSRMTRRKLNFLGGLFLLHSA